MSLGTGVALTLVVAACGVSAADHPAAGSLYTEAGPDSDPLIMRTGAAGPVVECDSRVTGGFSDGLYDNGAVASDPAGAIETAAHEAGFDGARSGYEVAVREDTRVLFTYDVGGETKQAIIVHDGPTIDGDGWYVESWARCDLAEFPDSIASEAGIQVWTDASGDRVPTTDIQSYAGPAHCDWQQMTFLEVGGNSYVRNPEPYLRGHFKEDFEQDLPLPADAVDTGYQRAGQQLWLSPGEERAYVGADRDHVELWPRETKRVACL